MNIYLTRLKILLRSKENIFWTFAFPLILGLFFTIGFGRLSNDALIDTTRVFVASENAEAHVVTILQEVELKEGVPLFAVSISNSKETLEEHLNNGDIGGYIFLNETDEIVYRVRQSGLSQTITKSFLDEYIQQTSLILQVQTLHPEALPSVLADLAIQREFITQMQTQTNDQANNMTMYYYALVAMACMFASYWGIGMINDVQANMSHLGIRVGVAPTHKRKLLLTYFLAAFTIQIAGNIVLILYLRFLLQIDFADQLGLVFLAAFIGSFSGISLGAFLSSIIKADSTKKEGFCTAISLILSFFAGLMFFQIKYFVAKTIPIMAHINPAHMLTDGLYRLYFFGDTRLYWLNMLNLVGVSLILLFIAYIRLRGEKYDSV